MSKERMPHARDQRRWPHPWRVLLFGLLFLQLPLGVRAQAVEPSPTLQGNAAESLLTEAQALDESVFPGLKTKISLDLRGMDMVEVLKFLASKGGFNVVAGPDVQGRATLTLNDVTVRDALEIVLVSNGLAIDRRGTILYVLSAKQYEELYGHRYGDPRESLILELKYADPAQVSALLGNMKSAVGRIIVDEPTATLAILDTPAVLAQMQALIARVDIPTIERELPTETHVVPLQFAKAEDVKAQVDSMLTPNIGQARLDKRSNALVVTDIPAKMPKLESLIRAFDARNRQVYIESTILSVTLRDEFDAGIEWEAVSETAGWPKIDVTNALSIASDVTNPIKLVVGTLSPNNITATVKALQTFGDTKVLSSPHITAMNNEEAKIHVGRKEVYVTSTTTTAVSTGSTAEQVNFIEVGVKLNVTPTINEAGFITMKIRPEVSNVAELRKTASGNTIPVVETSEAETTVMVKDGTTVIIGGLMKDETTFNKQSIPLLGNLPILGALFSNRSDRIKKTELVILLTPHLISGEQFVAPSSSSVRVDWPMEQHKR